MKKNLIVAMAVLSFGAVAAFAGTINIPHFVDDGNQTVAASGYFPTAGTATWITVTNTTDDDKVITVNFYKLNGDANGSSTGLLSGYRSAGFRPVFQDTFESALGQEIDPPTDPAGGGGWVQILFPGTASEIAGKAYSNSFATSSSYGWTLIPYD